MISRRMCVRCRKVEVPDGLHWCPSCLTFLAVSVGMIENNESKRELLALESSYLHSLEVAKGVYEEDMSAEVAEEIAELERVKFEEQASGLDADAAGEAGNVSR